MDRMQLAIVGCGGMGGRHLRPVGRLKALEEAGSCPFDLVGACDVRQDNAEYLAGRAAEMLDRERLDVISIGTWQSGHAAWTIAAAARRPQAIVCEKPMADTLGGADQMQVACQRNGVKLIVGHQRRFLPAYTYARELIAQGAIGDVQLVECFGADGLPNPFSHQADMLRYILGDDECEWGMGNVERKTDRYERGTRIEDCGVSVLSFRSGARATVLCDMVPMLGGPEAQGGRIYGSAGMMLLSPEELHILNEETGGVWLVHRPERQFYTHAEAGGRLDRGQGRAPPRRGGERLQGAGCGAGRVRVGALPRKGGAAAAHPAEPLGPAGRVGPPGADTARAVRRGRRPEPARWP